MTQIHDHHVEGLDDFDSTPPSPGGSSGGIVLAAVVTVVLAFFLGGVVIPQLRADEPAPFSHRALPQLSEEARVGIEQELRFRSQITVLVHRLQGAHHRLSELGIDVDGLEELISYLQSVLATNESVAGVFQ